ncbi:MAG: acyl-CoA/acyl-ACP dehydrogenase [Anaerolineae bacterium]|nr:acyl-CoA/acyl-ACP dehydrogenase [Anaerolineae bacterium]
MDFSWTKEEVALWDEISQFARTELHNDDLIERDQQYVFVEANWQKCAAKGLFGLAMPAEYGGSGHKLITTVHALEALGYGCPDNGLTLAVNGQTWSVQMPILKFGTDEQKRKYLPKLIDGSWKGAHAVTEPEAGSDVFAMATRAQKTEGGYILNGQKILVGMAPLADVYVLFATLNPTAGRWGVTAFIVDANTPGIVRGAPGEKMGLRTEPFGDITLNDVFVPRSNVLGREGSGASIFNASMTLERSFIFSSHLGSMARQLDDTIAYANHRKQGGQTIGKYQSVANRIANMKLRLETARSFLYKAAWMVDQGMDATLQAAMTKLTVSEFFVENSLDSIRVHGGRGYLPETGVERDLRDAVGGVLYAGTSDIQRNLIAALLGL